MLGNALHKVMATLQLVSGRRKRLLKYGAYLLRKSIFSRMRYGCKMNGIN